MGWHGMGRESSEMGFLYFTCWLGMYVCMYACPFGTAGQEDVIQDRVGQATGTTWMGPRRVCDQGN